MSKKPQNIDKNLFGIWKFDKLAVENMKNLTRDTKYSGIEQGGLLCSNLETKKITLQKQCTGSKCEIEIPKGCDKDTFYTGFFHTHPTAKKHELSLGDIINYNERGDFLGCLGVPQAKRNNIICYTNKSNSDKYWEEKTKEKHNLQEMLEIELKLHKKQPTKGIIKMIKYRKEYQDKFLTKFNPEDYVSEE